MKELIVFIGLPGSGKTTYIKDHFVTYRPQETLFPSRAWKEKTQAYLLISADDIKERHPEYRPEAVTPELHKHSVEEAEKQVIQAFEEKVPRVIFDGGGINRRYQIRIMEAAKNKDYQITLIYIDTPLKICLERLKRRDRQVPIEVLVDKSLFMEQCFEAQKLIANKVIYDPYYRRRIGVFDMDGTICSYLSIGNTVKQMDYVNTNMFRAAKPVKPMIDKIWNMEFEEIWILSVSPNSIANQQKTDWLQEHFICPTNPMFPVKRYFVGSGKHKVQTLLQLLVKNRVDIRDILFVDDLHEMLWEATDKGIEAMHPSRFLTI